MSFTLKPVGDTQDRGLHVFVIFEHLGDASYLWRLNPAK